METGQQGVHLRKLSLSSSRILTGNNGLINSQTFQTEIKKTRKSVVLGNPTCPSLGVILSGAGAKLEWTGHSMPLQRWCWFYIPANCTATIAGQDSYVSFLMIRPVKVDQEMLETAKQGEPVVAPIQMLKVIRKEGRITFNAAGDGCPIDRPFFMASFCIYDQQYGIMPQHVHTDQEECMLVLSATGNRPTFRFSSHSVELQNETLVHVFPGDYHGFAPADGKIAIVALYQLPTSNAGVKMEAMRTEDIALWNAVADS